MRMEFKRAEDEVRTRDLNLGKVALYQLSYFRIENTKLSRTVGRSKIRNTSLSEKFLSYLYWGVYNVLLGTFTSGLPL
jgi:hypothetical protein